MSSTSVLSGINSNSWSMMEELLAQQSKQDSEVLNSTYGSLSSKVNSTANSAKSLYDQPSITSEVTQAALKKALAALQERGEGFISFSKIANYQKELEDTLSTTMRMDLFELGVPLETDFTVKLSSDGKISVECNDPAAKAIIEKYLSDNPKVCEQFGYIQALANVERARQSPFTIGTAMSDTKAQLQASAVEAFMSGALESGLMNYADMLASFGGSSGNTKFYAGLSFKV